MTNLVPNYHIKPWEAPTPPIFEADWFTVDKMGRIKSFDTGIFIDSVLMNPDVCVVTLIDDSVCVWDGTKWCMGNKFIDYVTLHFFPNSTQKQRKEVVASLIIKLNMLGENHTIPAMKVQFNNGVFDIDKYLAGDDGYFKKPDYSDYIANSLPYDWNPDAYSETVDKFLDSVSNGDAECRQSILEMIAMCFIADNKRVQQSCMAFGVGSNGKSVTMDLITSMFGESNVESLRIDQLTDNMIGKLQNKTVYIDPDVDASFLAGGQIGRFKSITAGDRMTFRQPYCVAENFTPYCKFIACFNSMFKVGSDSINTALTRRLHFINFSRKFNADDADYDPLINEKLCTPDAISYVYKLAMDVMPTIVANNFKYTPTKFSESVKEGFVKDNDSVAEWADSFEISQYMLTFSTVNNMPEIFKEGRIAKTNHLNACVFEPILITPYEHYEQWARKNNRKAVKQRGFTNRLKELFDIAPSKNRWTATSGVRYPFFKRSVELMEGSELETHYAQILRDEQKRNNVIDIINAEDYMRRTKSA